MVYGQPTATPGVIPVSSWLFGELDFLPRVMDMQLRRVQNRAPGEARVGRKTCGRKSSSTLTF